MTFNPALPTSYEYIHYTSENLDTLDLSRIYPQNVEKCASHTPNGLWLSIAGINDWEQYCLKNNYNLHNLKYEFQIKLKSQANMLILYNAIACMDFEQKYALSFSIRWEDIINDYQGIALPHVIPKWSNIWRCTFACIWDLQAVEKVYRISEEYTVL